MNSQDFIKVPRKNTIIVPKSVVKAILVKDILSYIFILYSIITIILYFSNTQYPQLFDVIVSLVAISIPVIDFLYVKYKEKKYKLDSIVPNDNITFTNIYTKN